MKSDIFLFENSETIMIGPWIINPDHKRSKEGNQVWSRIWINDNNLKVSVDVYFNRLGWFIIGNVNDKYSTSAYSRIFYCLTNHILSWLKDLSVSKRESESRLTVGKWILYPKPTEPLIHTEGRSAWRREWVNNTGQIISVTVYEDPLRFMVVGEINGKVMINAFGTYPHHVFDHIFLWLIEKGLGEEELKVPDQWLSLSLKQQDVRVWQLFKDGYRVTLNMKGGTARAIVCTNKIGENPIEIECHDGIIYDFLTRLKQVLTRVNFPIPEDSPYHKFT